MAFLVPLFINAFFGRKYDWRKPSWQPSWLSVEAEVGGGGKGRGGVLVYRVAGSIIRRTRQRKNVCSFLIHCNTQFPLKKIQKWASAHFQSRFETHFSFFPPSSLSSSSSEQSTSTYTVFPLHRAHVVWTGNLFASFQTWLHSTERRKKIPVVLFPNFFLFFLSHTNNNCVSVCNFERWHFQTFFFSLSPQKKKVYFCGEERERERKKCVPKIIARQ